MKKHVFFSLLALAALPVFGQSVVQVEQLAASYGAAPTVTFRVYWNTAPDNNRHRSNVWIFVDYLPFSSDGTPGAWTPATISRVVSVSDGTPSYPVALPYRGFYLQGNPSGAFSSTVTVALDGLANAKFNWCAYANDYPPNATEAAGYYALHGAPPFVVNGSTTVPSKTYTGGCITAITDATGCPGIAPALPAVTAFVAQPDTICAGDTATLVAAATGATAYSFDGGVSWQTGTTVKVAPTSDTAYTLTIRNAAGCTVTATPLAVTVHPLPTPAFVNPPSTACVGSEVTLTATGGSSYCFTQECVDCIRNPYESGNDEEGAAHCYHVVLPCTYTPDSTYTLTMPANGSVKVWARVMSAYGCVDSVSATIGATSCPASFSLLTGNADQSLCSGEAISPIHYATARASSIAYSGLPSGLNTAWDGSLATISGVPAETGVFPYTVSITGAFGNDEVSGTFTVRQVPALSLTSAETTENQRMCMGDSIDSITYNCAGATQAMVTGLPDGTVYSFHDATIIISGVPVVDGLFPYTVEVTDGYCPVSTNGSSGVYATPPVPSLTHDGPKCNTAITFTASDGSGAYDWSGAFSGDGATKITDAVAGSYTASVRSVEEHAGLTCYSAYSSEVTGAVISVGAANGQAANTCGCVSGTTDCSGTCKTNTTYNTNDGACTGSCHTAYVRRWNQCGLVSATYSTYTNNTCNAGCPSTPTRKAGCRSNARGGIWSSYAGACETFCQTHARTGYFPYFDYTYNSSTETCTCYSCNY